MKTFRLLNYLLAVVLCIGFVSCSDDDDDNDDASLIGKWKIEKSNERGEDVEWDGYPYFVVTSTHFYFTDDKGVDKSDYCTYTYDTDKKIMVGTYISGNDNKFTMEILKLTKNELNVRWDEGEEGTHMITIYCNRVN